MKYARHRITNITCSDFYVEVKKILIRKVTAGHLERWRKGKWRLDNRYQNREVISFNILQHSEVAVVDNNVLYTT